MERVAVKSSNIASIGYDQESKVLEVEFHPPKDERVGRIYEHYGVPPELHTRLMAANSIGKFYQVNIRGKFDYKQLEPEQK